ncbi:DUF3078 domain-containing protein [Ilyomonas limi]|uniref:DUF3078 domain-containing protein n=1 Tax=Ilyomonas limi TaxID=2575867 RepID=A0A4U3L203_9BACT|nr:DUF3078 domain-containing protein [Ilyomonas limi]TKK68910.1 DUF3078 domain-containing protein [Ilyomonas limi]
MNKFTLITFLFLAVHQLTIAQDIPVKVLPNEIFRNVKKDANDTSQWKWKRGGVLNANLAQGSLSNWSAGGDNFSLSFNTYVNYSLFYRKGRHSWDNSLDFNLGFVQTTSLGSRKNDDRYDLLSKYGYSIDTSKKWYLSTLFDFRSQLFDGRTYYSKDSSSLASTFLSPAYLVLSVGFDFKPRPTFSFFLSPLTNRTTFVASNKLSNLSSFGVSPGNHAYNEVGAFASINFFTVITKDINYKGRLDLFSNYGYKPLNIDFYMTNAIAFKITKFLAATYNLDMIYDDDVKFPPHGARLQLRSQVGFGFTMPFAQEKH